MKETARREYDGNAYSIEFETEHGRTFFNPTGDEVCFGDPKNCADWWLEYENPEDPKDIRYGR